MNKTNQTGFELPDAKIIILKEILYNSTGQAFLKVYNSKSLTIKLFWIACLVIASGSCSYFVIQTLFDFFSYKVNTVITNHYESSSPFPKITICNKNPNTTKYAYELKKNSSVVFNSLDKNLTVVETSQLSHSFDDIFSDCLFNNQNCTANDFVLRYDRNLGNCFTFNSGFNSSGSNVPIKETSQDGPKYGLKIGIYVNFYEELKRKYSGVIVKIDNTSLQSTSFGHELAPGFKYNLIVERYFEKYLPKPFSSNCDIDTESEHSYSYSDLYELIYHSEYVYSRRLCYDLCLIKIIIEKCNCSLDDTYGFFPNINKK